MAGNGYPHKFYNSSDCNVGNEGSGDGKAGDEGSGDWNAGEDDSSVIAMIVVMVLATVMLLMKILVIES